MRTQALSLCVYASVNECEPAHLSEKDRQNYSCDFDEGWNIFKSLMRGSLKIYSMRTVHINGVKTCIYILLFVIYLPYL